MDTERIRSIKSTRLFKLVTSNRLAYRIARYLYLAYDNRKNRREFLSRISQLDPDEYLDTSYKPHLNVIILVVDCLRNSHLSCQGYSRDTTPFLDSMGSRFVAISASPWTYPSVPSILSGLYPHNHNAIIAGRIKNVEDLEGFRKLRRDILTLPEILPLLGYGAYFGTAVELAFYPLRARVTPRRYAPTTPADTLLSDLAKWISRQNGKFFAYVHLGDLHFPMSPPHTFRNFFGNTENFTYIDARSLRRPHTQEADAEKARAYKHDLVLLYDNTLRYVDHAIERFYCSLERAGLTDSTIIIVTADHGNEFWEHEELEASSFYHSRGYYGFGHGHNVFNEIIEVPLLMSGPIPRITPPRFASSVDIVPTLTDLLGINHSMTFDGRSLLATDLERPLLSEACGYGYEKKALILGRYKLIYSKDDGIEWVFDLEKDPHEQRPIVDKEVTSIFVDKLHRLMADAERRRIGEHLKRRSVSRGSSV